MKKILIGVVVVLLIAGVIGGSFALANHFKKSEVTPDEKPVVKPSEPVLVDSVLKDGSVVNKLYVNTRATLPNDGAESLGSCSMFVVEKGKDVDALGIKDDYSFKEKYFTSPDSLGLCFSSYLTTVDRPVYYSAVVNLMEGDKRYAAYGNKLTIEYSLYNNGVSYQKTGEFTNVKTSFDEKTGVLCIDFGTKEMVLKAGVGLDKLTALNLVSQEPFYKVNDKNSSEQVENTDKVVNEPNLVNGQKINKLYFNPNFAVDEAVDAKFSSIDAGVVGTLVKVTDGMKAPTEADRASYFNDIRNQVTNNDSTTFCITTACGSSYGKVKTIAIGRHSGDPIVAYRYDAETKKSTLTINNVSTPDYVVKDNCITFTNDYYLVIRDSNFDEFVNANIISTKPFTDVSVA